MTRTSRAFDRAADSHDQTRLLPEPITLAGIQATLANYEAVKAHSPMAQTPDGCAQDAPA